MRSHCFRGFRAWVPLLLGIAAGCSASSDLAPGEDPVAASVIDKLREQFRVPEIDPLTGETRWVPFLKPSYIVRTSQEGERPAFGIDPKAGAVSAEFELPDMSNSRTSIGRSGRARSLSFTPGEAMPVGAKLGRGYLLFSSAHPQGGHMIRGATSEGLEDYVIFGRRPPTESLRYQIELGSEVAGLRRIGNAIEALDAEGRTQLRITEPTLVDSKGLVVTANLDVEGCVADTEPSVSEERPVLPPYSRSCAVVVTWDGAALEYPVLVDPTWVSAGSMAFARAYFTLSWLPSGYAIAIGGAGSDGRPVSAPELYDPVHNSWSLRTPLHYARSRHTATPLWDGKVLVTGGLLDGNVATAKAELVDISSSTWDDVSPIPGPARYAHTATPLFNGSVFIVGGMSGTASSTALADAFIYFPKNDAWFPAPNRTARYGHSATSLPDGNVLVVGGINSAGAIKSADLYLSSINSWSAGGSISAGRAYHTATLLRDGKVLVAGGAVPSALGFIPLSNVDLYEAGVWKAGPPMNVARVYATANLLPDGKVLVVGGYGVVNGTVSLVNSNEIYDPAAQKWTLIESTASAHALHASVSIPNSNAAKNAVANPTVVIAGGYSTSTSVTRSAELLTTASCPGWMSPGDGSGGVFAPSANTVLASGLYQFAAIDIRSGVKVTASGSGVLDLRAATTASVSGTLDVSGSKGGSGHTVQQDKKGGNGGGGATGNPDSPGVNGENNTCYNGVALGGDGYSGSGKGENGSRCGNGGGKNGGGVGGACDGAYDGQVSGSGAGGGGYGGGGGGRSGYPVEGGKGGGTYGGESRKGGSGPSMYRGGNGLPETNYDYATGGSGGSIGSDAAKDLAALTTFRTGSGGGGGGADGNEDNPKYGGGGGGGGGGVVRIVSAGAMLVPATGSVLARGGDGGYAGQKDRSGGGGGGSGGLIVLAGDTLSVLGKVNAAGGAGGLAGTDSSGGAGGMGRIVLSAASSSGCTLSSANVTPALLNACTGSTGAACTGSEPECGKAYVLIGSSLCAGLTVAPLALSSPSTNIPYNVSVTLSASGGAGLGYSYSMLTRNTGSSVDASTGVFTTGNKQGTDTIEVKDSLGNKATLALTVVPISATGSASVVLPRGTLSFSATGGQGTYSWKVSPNRSGATIDPSTGSYAAGATGSVIDTVVVTDALGGTYGVDVSIMPSLTISPSLTSVTPRGTQTFTVTGGSGTGYTWTVPSYPSGGTHASSASGDYKAGNTGGVTDVVRVTDSLGNYAEARVGVGPNVTVTTPTVNVAARGTVKLVATGGSGTGYTWTIYSRASGTSSINASTGDYTAGTFTNASDVVQVTDSLGATSRATIHVGKLVVISPASLDAFKPQDQRTFTATGGSGTGYTWIVLGSSGASIDATTGAYKAGSTGYTQDTVQVTDSVGNSTTAVINVGARLSITPASVSVQQNGSASFTALGGSGGYTWLPPSEGHGTMSDSGTYTAGSDCQYTETVTVRDSLMNTASATVQVGTCFEIVASATTVPANTGTVTLSTIGGSGIPPVWSISSTSGGKFDSMSGIYTAGSIRNSKDTITAKDSLGNAATITIQVY